MFATLESAKPIFPRKQIIPMLKSRGWPSGMRIKPEVACFIGLAWCRYE